MERRRVFITGIGLVSSIGNDKVTAFDSLKNLKHGFSPFTPYSSDLTTGVKLTGNVKGFEVDAPDFEDWVIPSPYKIKRTELRSLAPHGVYVYASMVQAIEDARLSEEDTSNVDTGIYTASAGSTSLIYRNMTRMHQLGAMRCPPTGIVSSISGTLSFNLVGAFKIQGNSCGFSSACASSAHALGYAYEDIACGRQNRMFIAAGEDVNDESVIPFSGMRALSLESDPTRASCPFDKARSGFVCTGGGAVVVLESEEEVERRGVTPYAELVGWGQASDGHNVAISHPEGRGLIEALRRAIKTTGIDAGAVDYINAHATSTLIGDASEGKALKTIFADNGYSPAISSTKALTGHGLSLASALETVIISLCMREGITPGSAHIQELDPVFDGLNIIRETLPRSPELVVSNSSGFGGANVSLVLRKV